MPFGLVSQVRSDVRNHAMQSKRLVRSGNPVQNRECNISLKDILLLRLGRFLFLFAFKGFDFLLCCEIHF